MLAIPGNGDDDGRKKRGAQHGDEEPVVDGDRYVAAARALAGDDPREDDHGAVGGDGPHRAGEGRERARRHQRGHGRRERQRRHGQQQQHGRGAQVRRRLPRRSAGPLRFISS